MSRVYPSTKGCPFRKIVKRERVPGAFSQSYIETLLWAYRIRGRK